MPYEATVKATGEKLYVYKLGSGNYYDYKGMGENEPMSAPRSGKKEFEKHELHLGQIVSHEDVYRK